MMKKVFVAYGDEKSAYSLRRIIKQAKKIRVFDEVVPMTPQDLPDYIKNSILMRHSYGGGYWAWKPCIIKEILSKYDDNTIVCYADAGCTLKKSIEWTLYFELMKDYDMVCFKYKDMYPQWEKFGSTSTKIKHWGKKNTLLFLDDLLKGKQWRECNKIWGGLLFVKGKCNPIVNEWLDITLTHPEIIIDPDQDEMKNQYPYFALHKHDQVLLVALAYKYKKLCLVLPELSETSGENVAVFASRIRARNLKEYIVLRIKYWGRKILGDRFFEDVKRWIGKK